ncbi:FMN adenylyltransferase / Riboflavin kinase [hydrothermal vent metagenome]|uniref:Bifunctional riboflavin kinase/FMN adenylyltransferase n=1 Tax=hydrothermal vent metagenome TaxID=652676 RepID=A0A3B0TD11_9ZZZZ
MDVVRGNEVVPVSLRGGALALGNFDGVHLGHREVLRLTMAEAKRIGGPAGVVFFDPHPRRFFQPGTPYFRLTPQPMKLKLLEELGLDVAFVLPFDEALAATTAETFMTDILKARFGASCVIAGWNFRFGNGRKGSAGLLEARGPGIGFEVRIVQPSVDSHGEPVSATRIRDLLGAGRPGDAAALLGYRWQVTGPVLAGEKRGRTLGFPTANMALEAGVDVANGSYAVRAFFNGSAYDGAAYLGTRPVFGGEQEILETHLFDFDGDLYGKDLTVELVEYLRGDMDFPSVEALTQAIAEDCRKARAALAQLPGAAS